MLCILYNIYNYKIYKYVYNIYISITEYLFIQLVDGYLALFYCLLWINHQKKNIKGSLWMLRCSKRESRSQKTIMLFPPTFHSTIMVHQHCWEERQIPGSWQAVLPRHHLVSNWWWSILTLANAKPWMITEQGKWREPHRQVRQAWGDQPQMCCAMQWSREMTE